MLYQTTCQVYGASAPETCLKAKTQLTDEQLEALMEISGNGAVAGI